MDGFAVVRKIPNVFTPSPMPGGEVRAISELQAELTVGKPELATAARAAEPLDCSRCPAATPGIQTSFDEPWAAVHNFQTWNSGPDGTYGAWCNDATGYSFDE